MRIKSEIKRLGYFWMALVPEKKVPGVLTISDGGVIALEVVGMFDEYPEAISRFFGAESHLIRLNGLIEEYGPVTLEDCFFKTQSMSLGGGIAKSHVHVGHAFIGVLFEAEECVLLNRFKFSVEGIDEWFGLSGIGVETDFARRSATVTYQPLEEVVLNLVNNMTLKITFSWTFPGLPRLVEAKITQKVFFELASANKLPFSDFISTAHKITTFLGLAVDRAVCVDRAFAESDDIAQGMDGGASMPISIGVYYDDPSYIKNVSKISTHDMLFRYGRIKDNAEVVVNNWIRAYEVVDPSLRLYFSVKTGAQKYIEGRFLSLAQGIETYHRRQSSEGLMDVADYEALMGKVLAGCPEDKKDWLYGRLKYGNELSFSRRLVKMIEPFKNYFGTSKQRNKLIRSIVDSRNYLTHYDLGLKESALEGAALHRACLQLEALFQFHFLVMLGFNPSEINSIVRDSRELQHKLQIH